MKKLKEEGTQKIETTQNDLSQADMMAKFAELQNKNEMAEVLKELFVENKIYLITDLTKDEIKLMTRIYLIADMKNIEIWKTGLGFYCKLLLSQKRKSRKEILEAIKGYTSAEGFMSKLNPKNWGK